ncbi:MAG: diphthamide synthesis protein [Candidatus Pacearchaeota archaeon]
MKFELEDLEKKYELELDIIVAEIKESKAKSILVQLPDGLKPWAVPIVKYLEDKTSVDVKIWLGSCFGACDVPKSDCDLLIQFGHAKWA